MKGHLMWRLTRNLLVVASVIAPGALSAAPVGVTVDSAAATSVLQAVQNPRLTLDEAQKIAGLPGNQGLIRKAREYGRTASNDTFAQALVAAAHGDPSYVDVSKFNFADVRTRAAQTRVAIAALNDPGRRLLEGVKARIAQFTPSGLTGQVTGYLVVGGTSGGFAFGDPKFFLNLDRFPSPEVASTIMGHELFHAVQALARGSTKTTPAETQCLQADPHAQDVSNFFGSLSAEGTAAYVGDLLTLLDQDKDVILRQERSRFARNVGLVARSITQLELSIHGLSTNVSASPSEIYALGFYGDEVMYSVGYVMARAIAKEEGEAAIAASIERPGAAFVQRYVRLKSYGKSDAVPVLKSATIRWADKLATCAT